MHFRADLRAINTVLQYNQVREPPKRWLLMPVAIMMTLCALALGRLAYGLLLPSMRIDLDLTLQQAGNLSTASSLGYLIFVLPAGFIASRYGPRASILAGLLLLAGGFASLALANDYFLLLCLMTLLGLGTALLYTPVVSLVVGWFPNRRGSLLGVANSGVGIGAFANGFYVPWIIGSTGDAGWRTAWLSFAVVAAGVLLSAFFLVRNPPGFAGKVIAGAGGEALAESEIVEKTTSRALIVYRSSSVRLIGAVYAVLGFTYIVQAVFVYSYALEAGVPARTAGALLAAGGFMSIFASTLWGAVSDVIGRSNALTICFLLSAVATLTPVLFPTVIGFAIHFGVSGLVVAGLFTCILAATSEQAAARDVPIAIGFVTLLFAIGQLLGPALAAWIIERSGYQMAFSVSASLMLAGAALAFLLRSHEASRR